jgi:hypothetical protein
MMFAEQCISKRWARTKASRIEIEEYNICCIKSVPTISDWHSSGFRILKLSNLISEVTLVDLMSITIKPDTLGDFNPFLSKEACDEILGSILLWLQLCVLEDKAERLLGFLRSNLHDELVAELQSSRIWSVCDHREWLVFEVKQSLQIRPNQYKVAQGLIEDRFVRDAGKPEHYDRPGMIAQLNMGEGKTRVIPPMVVIHFGRQSGGAITRLHFLSPLLHEAFEYLHRTLCAGTLNIPLLLLPFNRDVKISTDDLKLMHSQIEECRASCGAICIAREHRASLQLKRHEQDLADTSTDHDTQARRAALKKVFNLVENHPKYVDIFDESDEIMRQRFQLIYAVGEHQSLPSGPNRWNAAEALLRVIAQSRCDLLFDPAIAVREGGDAFRPGTFPPLRLLAGEALEGAMPALLHRLGEELLSDPPYELAWLKNHPSLREPILAFVTKAGAVGLGEAKLGPVLGGGSDEMQSLWALRGLLAFQTLMHCLGRRHCVNYGVKRPGKKRLAVPFHAADTTSDRSEFSQPDVALVYTILSYYFEGLSAAQTLEAFDSLLRLGPSAQDKVYSQWLTLSKASMPEADHRGLNSVLKIDPSNEVQRKRLVHYFRSNMSTINFWLNTVVLPAETLQFSKRLAANCWHLCEGRPMGFSGTNDNKLLLPLQVKQADPREREIAPTNGKMLALLYREKPPLFCREGKRQGGNLAASPGAGGGAGRLSAHRRGRAYCRGRYPGRGDVPAGAAGPRLAPGRDILRSAAGGVGGARWRWARVAAGELAGAGEGRVRNLR